MLTMGNELRVKPDSLMLAMTFSLASMSAPVATDATWSATGPMANLRISRVTR